MLGDRVREYFEVRRGLRQGCVMGEERLVKRMYRANVKDNRGIGRPQRR